MTERKCTSTYLGHHCTRTDHSRKVYNGSGVFYDHTDGSRLWDDGPADVAYKPEKRTWDIRVCKTCDRLAEYPFCEHRELALKQPPYDYKWYETIRVREV